MSSLRAVWLVEEQVAVGAWRGHWFTKTLVFENRRYALLYIAGMVANAGAERRRMRTVKFFRTPTQPVYERRVTPRDQARRPK